MKEFFFEIIPLNKIALDRPQIYTYRSAGDPASFYIGQIVKIPFGKGFSAGIIANSAESPNNFYGEIKNINSILFSDPILTIKQIKLAKWLSSYYLCPLGVVIKTMVPNLPKRIIPSDISTVIPSPPGTDNNKPLVIMGNFDYRLKEYLKIIKKNLFQKKQIVILAPELLLLERIKDILTYEFDESIIAEISGNIPAGKYFRNWMDIIKNKKNIVCGTSQAVLAPFKDLGTIIVDEEPNNSYKQWDRNPRYDSRRLAMELSKINNCRLVYGGNSFSVNTYHRYQKYGWDMKSQKLSIHPSIKIADMRDEIRSGNFTIFSEILKNELGDTLKNKKQAIIIVGRPGQAKFVLCRDCGYVFKCRDCSSSLALDYVGNLYCTHCSFKKTLPALCPVCRSTRIKDFGIGTDRTASELKKIFPTAKISVYDRNQIKNTGDFNKIYQRFDTAQIDILVGTLPVLSLNSNNVSLVASLDFDSMAFSPGWQSNEKSFDFLAKLQGDHRDSKIIIQTYRCENSIFGYFYKNPAVYYADELIERKRSDYPPFTKIIKMIFKDQSLPIATKRSNQVKKKIEDALGENTKTKLIGPYKPAVFKIRNIYFLNLILKIPSIEEKEILKMVKNFILEADQADVDPLDIS
jgi:primosomal protein N' (replication factor Y) (superfamily II helicase)